MEEFVLNPEKIAFLVDSCAELEPRHCQGIPVYIVPLRITRLEAGELPKTSLPQPSRVEETLAHIKADGYERVIALPLSSGLSGTHNMIRIACEEREDLITAVFDTCSGAIPLGAMVLQLWEDIQNGMSWAQLMEERVPHLLKNTHPYFSVDTLEYLQKGGRIGKITALAGTVLNIKPILTFAEDGQLVNVAKVRGRKQGLQPPGGQRRGGGGDGAAEGRPHGRPSRLPPRLGLPHRRHPGKLYRPGGAGGLYHAAGLTGGRKGNRHMGQGEKFTLPHFCACFSITLSAGWRPPPPAGPPPGRGR